MKSSACEEERGLVRTGKSRGPSDLAVLGARRRSGGRGLAQGFNGAVGAAAAAPCAAVGQPWHPRAVG